ncbi:MAG: cysteine--tRNA ligase [Spirochaetaceae bacterium]|jgi:cysteinyl-tRNA synthetase|nr:cysteine--tRNA ligase [Spirochaetaceae bacterium]
MSLTLFNTLGRELRVFKPITAGKVGFYGCGPTVYNYAHIGNLRAYVLHDVLVRTLRRMGFEVTHVMNITDVGHLSGDNDDGDDKMVKSAQERGKSVLEVAEFYARAFFNDTRRLNITPPTVICRATEHIGDMIALIKKIEGQGFTYSAGGNLYFDITKFPRYGELARLRLEDLKAGARIGVDENKRNPHDFVLWFTKSKFENQALVWESPWGTGYPGWHIECSAMSIKYLGETFDIHAGGIDHVAIHHTNEIAQSEAAMGRHPWVNYWVHNEFLVLDRGKMSKSSGGFLTLQSLVDAGYDPLDYRYFLLGGHYRSQLQFSYQALESAQNARKSLIDRIMDKASALGPAAALPEPEPSAVSALSQSKAGSYLDAFNKAMEDDLSTPRGLAELWGLLRDPETSPQNALLGAFDMDRVLGLNLAAEAERRRSISVPPELKGEIERLVAARAEAKRAKNFAEADRIRQTLRDKGVALEDRPGGTVWRCER